jgi:hypothetical protein
MANPSLSIKKAEKKNKVGIKIEFLKIRVTNYLIFKKYRGLK